MNKRGFTLVELLGVIIILSIIMMMAIPNITTVLEKGKRENYVSDAKKFISQVEYVIRNSNIEKPTSEEILQVKLSYIGTRDIKKDSDGNKYDTDNSYVIIVRKNGYLEYYVNLVTTVEGKNHGIRLANKEKLEEDEKLSLVKHDFTNPEEEEIKEITEVNGNIKIYK